MTLPPFNITGDLPVGIHPATLTEIVERFGVGHATRVRCAQHLTHIYTIAQHTQHLQRFILFGSFITNKPEPNDVDIVLVMDDLFKLENCLPESLGLFDHAIAQARYGASIFWARPALLIGETIDEFIAYWQIKRDKTLRGIVEVIG